MDQVYHDDATSWPTPLNRGILVEVDYTENEHSGLFLPGGNIRNTETGRVRNISPQLSEAVFDEFLPEGPGSFGKRVLFPRALLSPLETDAYQHCGLEIPDPENNGKTDLAFIDINYLVGIMKDDDPVFEITDGAVRRVETGEEVDLTTVRDSDEWDDFKDVLAPTLPFTPMGRRVFFEFDYDDESIDTVDQDGNKVGKDDAVEQGTILMREKAKATESQIATIIGIGPDVHYLRPGDRIIAKRSAEGVPLNDETYRFVETEEQIQAIL